jgi:5'-methylthioadenosine phosphorylase/purine-nucleoside phosphorylase
MMLPMPTPIHLRAQPGDYAPAVLVPGDPRRAEHIAKTFFDSPRLVNEERGMLGFTGTFEGQSISVQASGMGCPSAAIVYEELIMLGAERLIRVGEHGQEPAAGHADGRPRDRAVGDAAGSHRDLVRRRRAARTDGDRRPSSRLMAGLGNRQEPHLVDRAPTLVFYDRDTTRHARWAERGNLAVEMEAAVLYTIAALRKVSALTVLTVSDYLYTGQFERIGDDELRAGVDRMTGVAARVAVSS